MGIIRQGILGGFRNKTGSIVGSYWRSLDVIKALPRSTGKTPTQLQLDQRAKFGMVTSFLSWISPLIDVGFRSVSHVATPMNMATSYHLKEAITGIAPDFTIDYAKVLYSVGRLTLPDEIEVGTSAAAQLVYSWTDDGDYGKLKAATDMATIMVYNPAKSKFVTLVNAAERSAEEYTLFLPSNFSGDNVHCYLSFNSVETKFLVSESVYLGSTMVI